MVDEIGNDAEKVKEAFIAAAQKRHNRDGEDYLKTLLKSSQYIRNVATILDTAADEMRKGTAYSDGQELKSRSQRLNAAQQQALDMVAWAKEASVILGNGLDAAESLATGKKGMLSDNDVNKIYKIREGTQIARMVLEHIAEQQKRPTLQNGLTEDTITNAQGALDVMQNRLERIVNEAALMDDAVRQHNDDYTKRMAEARRHKNPYEIPVETRTEKKYRKEQLSPDANGILMTQETREQGYKDRQGARVGQYKLSSRKREEIRTDIPGGSYSERETARAQRENKAPENER